ncbi:hypothetical protein AB0M02_35345 [Actinoplanes sp. NPDC051861]|uniref:hypothetical protein n=1 Tax=Actinoplanes sp. NPDC051861 TaxID=3155170 RepID=UPI003434E09E
MSASLERRWARLLRLYPAEFRRARGAEVLDTLLASAEDGRMRPARREVAAFVLGALRAHAGRSRRPAARDSWLTACWIAALMLLVSGVADNALSFGVDLAVRGPDEWPAWPAAPALAALTLGLAAIWMVLRRWHLAGALVATAAVAMSVVVSPPSAMWPGLGAVWRFPLAVVLLGIVVLARRPPAAPAGLLRYLPLLPVSLVLTDLLFGQVFTQVTGILTRGLSVAVLAGALFWLLVDERVAMAVGLFLLNGLLVQAVFLGGEGLGPADVALLLGLSALGPAVLLSASATAARRQARV